jgi:CBS domain-containing protein
MTQRPHPQPSHDLVSLQVAQLREQVPFEAMDWPDVAALVVAATQRYYPPGSTILDEGVEGSPNLHILLQGQATARRVDTPDEARHLEAGELFPLEDLLAAQAPTARYTALQDCFCLLIPWPQATRVAQRSPVWAGFLQQRGQIFLEASQRRLREDQAALALYQQSWERPLRELHLRPVVTLPASAGLRQVLETMQRERIGSVVLTQPDGAAAGILTRHDLLERVVLPAIALDTPVSAVMSQPLLTLSPANTAMDAALLMTRHGLRHVPVVNEGRVTGMLSERDLFGLQSQSIHHVSAAIRSAEQLPALQQAANAVRQFTQHLLAQGLQAGTLTGLISHLNDLLTRRIVTLEAGRAGMTLDDACWLALGSEGREEQTIATDQDNAWVVRQFDGTSTRQQWLTIAGRVNAVLDACGFPLCRGGIMASNPKCCLSVAEWTQQFRHWITQASPQDLLKASVFFDLRAVAGNAAWVTPLQASIALLAPTHPLFLRALVENHLTHGVPLNWLGQLQGQEAQGHEVIDLKLQGTGLWVEAARIMALAQGISATSTRQRLQLAGARMHVAEPEVQAWLASFDYLQLLRLHAQTNPADASQNRNWLRLDRITAVDRQLLKSHWRTLRSVQQRLQLDYLR